MDMQAFSKLHSGYKSAFTSALVKKRVAEGGFVSRTRVLGTCAAI